MLWERQQTQWEVTPPWSCCPPCRLLGGTRKRPGATHLELVRFSCSDQLGNKEVCVEKVHVLIQEAVKDEQAVGPGRQSGGGSEVGALSSHPEAVCPRGPPQPWVSGEMESQGA